MNNDLNKQFNIFSIIASITGIVIGLLMLLLGGDTITNIIFIFIGVLIIIFNLPMFIQSIKDLKYKTPVAYSQFLSSLLTITIAIILIFWHDALTWIIGILMIIFSLLRIITSKEHWQEELIHQIPVLIFAVIILIIGIGGIVDILITILGWILLICSSLYLLFNIYRLIKKR